MRVIEIDPFFPRTRWIRGYVDTRSMQGVWYSFATILWGVRISKITGLQPQRYKTCLKYSALKVKPEEDHAINQKANNLRSK